MYLGVDLGGTKIEIIALDENGACLKRRRVASPRHDYEATLAAVCALVTETEAELGRHGSLGFGTPGAISRLTGRMKNSNSTWLNDRPLQQDLEARLGRRVRLANDANCFALSEAVDGAAAGAGSVFGVILGTGAGGGIVIDGKVLGGANDIAGEWGHNPLPWPHADELPGPACYCGRQGCLETYLSGPGLSARHGEHSGQKLRAEEIVAAAARGDAACRRSLDEYLDRLARGLAHVINILDPEVIVLGGGLSNVGEIYTEVPQRWQAYVFSDEVRTRLLPPRHGDSSGVRGAAWLWR